MGPMMMQPLGQTYPVLNGGSDKRSVPGVFIFPTHFPYSMGSRSELLRVSQPSNSHLRDTFMDPERQHMVHLNDIQLGEVKTY